MFKLYVAVCLAVAVSLCGAASSTEMTYEQYETALSQAQQQEMNAKEQIAQEQSAIESVRRQIDDIDQRILTVVQERYAVVGSSEQDALAVENEIASIRQELQDLNALAPEALLSRGAEIAKLEARISDLRSRDVTRLWKLAPIMTELESLLAQVKARVPVAQSSPGYTVRLNPQRRDCLYRIAQNPDVYGDATQWPRIYRANQGLIDAAYEKYRRRASEARYSRAEDLLYPGQILDIPR